MERLPEEIRRAIGRYGTAVAEKRHHIGSESGVPSAFDALESAILSALATRDARIRELEAAPEPLARIHDVTHASLSNVVETLTAWETRSGRAELTRADCARARELLGKGGE